MFGEFPKLPLRVRFVQLNATFADEKNIHNPFTLKEEYC